MYIIKQLPEDFIVNELFEFEETPGNYGIFLLKKKNHTTTSAVRIISRLLGIPLKNIGYAGMKDKKAVTTQHISIKNCKKEVEIENLKTEFLGTNNEPISLGDHEGNHFEIVVRDISKIPEINPKFINYFGEQRFSKNNVEIGLAMIKKDWKKACELTDHEEVKDFLSKNPSNYIGALKMIPLKVLKLFIAAYQSHLWNQTLQVSNPKPQTLIVPGFGVEISSDKMRELMSVDKISERDFIIRQFPQLTLEGVERNVFTEAKNLDVSELQEDELNKGKKKIILKFNLDNGCYATEFIKQLFENDN